MKVRTLLIALLSVAGGAGAQAPPAMPPVNPPPTASGPADAKQAEPVPDPDAAPPSKPAAAKGSPQRFEPSERVRPDFDVAFPVDI
jgi:hypothetical protein